MTLAAELVRRGHEVRLTGTGASQAPEVAVVHLFAGRSFRRSRLELEAFEEAVAYWRGRPEAVELPAVRWGQPGDRLEKSASSLDLPEARWAGWRPLGEPADPSEPLAGTLWRYGPTFAVLTGLYLGRLGEELAWVPKESTVQADEIEVLALGCGLQERLGEVGWDRSSGSLQRVVLERDLQAGLYLGPGFHLALLSPGCVGWLGGGRGDGSEQREAAGERLGFGVQKVTERRGERLALALDRRPLLGWLSARTFVFGGFGGRGFFWLPYCVKAAAEALERPDRAGAIPEGLRLERALGGGSGSEPSV